MLIQCIIDCDLFGLSDREGMKYIEEKTSISEREKRKIEQIAEALPDSVIVPEPEEPEQPSLL
ncbi:MAG: hypothetical protein ACM3VV_04800, partial [Deltaproteobacteria bacterium]